MNYPIVVQILKSKDSFCEIHSVAKTQKHQNLTVHIGTVAVGWGSWVGRPNHESGSSREMMGSILGWVKSIFVNSHRKVIHLILLRSSMPFIPSDLTNWNQFRLRVEVHCTELGHTAWYATTYSIRVQNYLWNYPIGGLFPLVFAMNEYPLNQFAVARWG